MIEVSIILFLIIVIVFFRNLFQKKMEKTTEKEQKVTMRFELNGYRPKHELIEDRIEFLQYNDSFFGWLTTLNQEDYQFFYDTVVKAVIDEEAAALKFYTDFLVTEHLKGNFTYGEIIDEADLYRVSKDIVEKLAVFEACRLLHAKYTIGLTDDLWDWHVNPSSLKKVVKDIPLFELKFEE